MITCCRFLSVHAKASIDMDEDACLPLGKLDNGHRSSNAHGLQPSVELSIGSSIPTVQSGIYSPLPERPQKGEPKSAKRVLKGKVWYPDANMQNYCAQVL
jgi:hypothetical protein